MVSCMDLSAEVQTALEHGAAIVALESTIITHGMPYPTNVETALAVEADVRGQGAAPATIAVLDGRLKVGLTADEIERLACNRAAVKTSRRDLASLIAKRGTGGTTVAATMICARLAGIRIFATGGIGGVHRNAQQTFDISADLEELARTPVAVVCAGVKSVLDLVLTQEYLETKGVPVFGFRSDDWPAFYKRHTGLSVDTRIETEAEAAAILRVAFADLNFAQGVVIMNPIEEAFALPGDFIDQAIAAALEQTAAAGIRGKAVTPYLLERLEELTGGASLTANTALVRHNAQVAARIALEYARLA
ncbi:MAG: pseudouridine-5'-phosphate glycosidase [Bacilli bacterium]